jgi:hypothetical protein
MAARTSRPVTLALACAVALAVVLAAVLAPWVTSGAPASAGGQRYSLNRWTDPAGKVHLVRWDPCRTITYAVNPDLASRTPVGRTAAVLDVKRAVHRAAEVTGLTFRYVGATHEVPTDVGSQKWAGRQRAADLVVAWVTPRTSTLLSRVGSGYASGTGGWMWKAWSSAGSWKLAIGRGFVVVNAQQRGDYAPGFGAGRTRGALLLHELGHALGLNHVGNTAELMYPTMIDRRTTGYKVGDRAGLRHVGRAAGCIGITPAVWAPLPG